MTTPTRCLIIRADGLQCESHAGHDGPHTAPAGREAMAETKWTPGPWMMDRNPDGRVGTHIRAKVTTYPGATKGVSVARITVGGGVGDEDKGNARLIAAAPDLYAALAVLLRDAENLLTEGEHEPAGFRLARRALARARGDE